MLRAFLRDEAGSTAMEYSLVATLIAIAIIVGVRNVGSNVATIYGRIGNAVTSTR